MQRCIGVGLRGHYGRRATWRTQESLPKRASVNALPRPAWPIAVCLFSCSVLPCARGNRISLFGFLQCCGYCSAELGIATFAISADESQASHVQMLSRIVAHSTRRAIMTTLPDCD